MEDQVFLNLEVYDSDYVGVVEAEPAVLVLVLSPLVRRTLEVDIQLPA